MDKILPCPNNKGSSYHNLPRMTLKTFLVSKFLKKDRHLTFQNTSENPVIFVAQQMNISINTALLETAESESEPECECECDNTPHLDDGIDVPHCMSVLNAILSGTARLNVLLPSFAILACTIFVPILTNDGKCGNLDRWLMGSFWAFCTASCIFFSITDSFRAANGRLYYGLATFNGIWTFNGGQKKPIVPSDYELRWSDLFYTSLSVIAFLTFTALQKDVQQCYYPAIPRKVTNTVPLVVGFVVSFLFVLFPSRRRGIGHPFLLQKLYSKP